MSSYRYIYSVLVHLKVIGKDEERTARGDGGVVKHKSQNLLYICVLIPLCMCPHLKVIGKDEDLSGDGGVVKHKIREGEGYEKATDGALLYFLYRIMSGPHLGGRIRETGSILPDIYYILLCTTISYDTLLYTAIYLESSCCCMGVPVLLRCYTI